MTRDTVRSVCPHRFLMVQGIDSTRLVETSRCYECRTTLIRPLAMFPPRSFHSRQRNSGWYPDSPL
jgi:hypothetical protein